MDRFLRKFLYTTFLFFVFFPYISFVNIGTDMQPYGAILAVILFFTFEKRFTAPQLCILYVFIFSTFILFLNSIDFTALRSYFNYFSLFFLSYATFNVLKTERINFDLFLKRSILVWFFIGLVQTMYDKSFMTFLVSGSRTTENRGVTSLAPEPTFYGIVLVFFIIFLMHLETPRKKTYLFICVFGVLVLAKSSMAVLFLAIIMFFYIITHVKLKYIFMSLAAIFIFPIFIGKFMSGTRLADLLFKVVDNPKSLVLVDASINDRFFHVFFSLKGFYDNNFLPNGYLSWNDYVDVEILRFSEYVIVEWFSVGGRIMSGYGSAFFELGVVAIAVPISLFLLYFSLFKNDFRKLVFFFLTINTIMFSAIPIGFSLYSFYLGFLGYLGWKKRSLIKNV